MKYFIVHNSWLNQTLFQCYTQKRNSEKLQFFWQDWYNACSNRKEMHLLLSSDKTLTWFICNLFLCNSVLTFFLATTLSSFAKLGFKIMFSCVIFWWLPYDFHWFVSVTFSLLGSHHNVTPLVPLQVLLT